MSKTIIALLSSAVLAGAGQVSAQTCDALFATKITPVTFSDAVQTLHNKTTPIKGEFETTDDYNTRVAASGSNIPETLIVSVPLDLKMITYNADKAAFEIKTYAVNINGAYWPSAFAGSPYANTIPVRSYGDLGQVVATIDRPTGTYTGQNAYGVSWTVTRVTRRFDGIFEGPPRSYGMTLFQPKDGPAPIWEMPVPLDIARALKPRLRAAFLIAPKAPFYFANTRPLGNAVTIDNPNEFIQNSRVIVADIRCLIITDDTNTVRFVVETN